MKTRFPNRRVAMTALALAFCGTTALAQNAPWPTKPLRLVVGFPAGSSPDLTARTLSEPLAQALGQPVVVDNKPGAGGNIGADLVAKATDGHTFGLMINGNMTIAKLLNPATPYDPLKDLAPVSLVVNTDEVLVTAANNPANTVPEFIAAVRARKEGATLASSGTGSVPHLAMEVLTDVTKEQVVTAHNLWCSQLMAGWSIRMAKNYQSLSTTRQLALSTVDWMSVRQPSM